MSKHTQASCCVANCHLCQQATSPLTREQVEDIDGLLIAMDGESDGWFGRAEAALKLQRRTIEQQAQEIERYKRTLEKIATPALGGKQQQWDARQALNEE